VRRLRHGDQHLAGRRLHLALARELGAEAEAAIAGGERLVGHQHPLAAPVGGDLADDGLAVMHRDLGIGRGAAGDDRAAHRGDANDIEARRQRVGGGSGSRGLAGSRGCRQRLRASAAGALGHGGRCWGDARWPPHLALAVHGQHHHDDSGETTRANEKSRFISASHAAVTLCSP